MSKRPSKTSPAMTPRQREVLGRLPKRFSVSDVVEAGCYKGELPAKGMIAHMLRAGLIRSIRGGKYERGAPPKCAAGRGRAKTSGSSSRSRSATPRASSAGGARGAGQLALDGRKANPEVEPWDKHTALELAHKAPDQYVGLALLVARGVEVWRGGWAEFRQLPPTFDDLADAIAQLQKSRNASVRRLVKMASAVLTAPPWRLELYARGRRLVGALVNQISSPAETLRLYMDWRDDLSESREPAGWRAELGRHERKAGSHQPKATQARPTVVDAGGDASPAFRRLVSRLALLEAFTKATLVAEAKKAGVSPFGLPNHPAFEAVGPWLRVATRRDNPETSDGRSWVLIGWDVRFELEGGGYHQCGRPWVLVTPSRGGELGGRMQLARLVGAAYLADVDEDAVVGWDEWSWGEDATEAWEVCDFEGVKGARRLGEIRRVNYTTRRAGEVIDYTHPFRGALPVLTAVGERGLRVDRRGSKHRVTDRGIVG